MMKLHCNQIWLELFKISDFANDMMNIYRIVTNEMPWLGYTFSLGYKWNVMIRIYILFRFYGVSSCFCIHLSLLHVNEPNQCFLPEKAQLKGDSAGSKCREYDKRHKSSKGGTTASLYKGFPFSSYSFEINPLAAFDFTGPSVERFLQYAYKCMYGC